MRNRIWLGYKTGDMAFRVPADSELRPTRYWQDKTGQKWRSLGNICWFTNLEIPKRHEELILFRKYTPESYPRYFNYDAIEVGRVENIPCDYDGEMGVPLTFLDKYNPEQFEIVGQSLELADMGLVKARQGKAGGGPRFYLEENGQLRRLFERLVVRRRK